MWPIPAYKVSKTNLPSRILINCIFLNPLNLQNMNTLGVGQFQRRISNNFFLKSIFLSSMSASIFFKVSQNWTKCCNKQNKQNKTNKQMTIFFAKNKFWIWKWSSWRAEKDAMPSSKMFYVFRKMAMVKNTKWWSKSNLPLSHSQDCIIFPLKSVLKNSNVRKTAPDNQRGLNFKRHAPLTLTGAYSY